MAVPRSHQELSQANGSKKPRLLARKGPAVRELCPVDKDLQPFDLLPRLPEEPGGQAHEGLIHMSSLNFRDHFYSV